jgi:hypothetical protein
MVQLEGYVRAALEAAAGSEHDKSCESYIRFGVLCSCHVRKAAFALSLYTKHGHLFGPTGAEFKAALGCAEDQNWVLCRRTARAVRQYGEDALYLSEKQYAAGELKALRTRMSQMGVKAFEPCV